MAVSLLTACADHAAGGAGGSGIGGSDARGGASPDNRVHDLAPADWKAPACDAVLGTVAVTFSTDGGKTLAPVVGPPPGNVVYTFDVAAGREPALLYAEAGGVLIRSTDAGCHWEEVTSIDHQANRLFSAEPDILYGLGGEGGLFRYSKLGLVDLMSQGPSGFPIESLFAFPEDGAHLMFASDGVLYESMDGGASYEPLSKSADHDLFRFSPLDPKVVIARFFSIEGETLEVSHDRGLSWQHTDLAPGAYVYLDVAISPIDSAIVWVIARNPVDQSNTLFYSGDYGETFKAVLTEPDAEPHALNNAVLTPSPFDASQVVVRGREARNSTISTYDAETTSLEVHAHPDTLIERVVFSPAGPSILYVPLSYSGHTN